MTDPRSFERPLSMTEALDKVDLWWRASEVVQLLASLDPVPSTFSVWQLSSLLHRGLSDSLMLAIRCVMRHVVGMRTTVNLEPEALAKARILSRQRGMRGAGPRRGCSVDNRIYFLLTIG
jgi:hypothetical protein